MQNFTNHSETLFNQASDCQKIFNPATTTGPNINDFQYPPNGNCIMNDANTFPAHQHPHQSWQTAQLVPNPLSNSVRNFVGDNTGHWTHGAMPPTFVHGHHHGPHQHGPHPAAYTTNTMNFVI